MNLEWVCASHSSWHIRSIQANESIWLKANILDKTHKQLKEIVIFFLPYYGNSLLVILKLQLFSLMVTCVKRSLTWLCNTDDKLLFFLSSVPNDKKTIYCNAFKWEYLPHQEHLLSVELDVLNNYSMRNDKWYKDEHQFSQNSNFITCERIPGKNKTSLPRWRAI